MISNIDSKDEIVDYFGPPLRREEADVLMAIFSLDGQMTPFRKGDWSLRIKDTHVTRLEILKTSIPSLPANIGNLKALTYLYISSRCRFMTLPESIGNLKALTELHISSRLMTLPESIGNLRALTKLDLSMNQLTALPESIGNLRALTSLKLGMNQLTALPESIGNFRVLIILELNKNKLTALPVSIGNLKALIYLNISGNKLTALPESIRNLKSLTTLELNKNKLTNLPESIGSLSTLAWLYASGNKLTSLPTSLRNLKSLEILGLSGNRFTSLKSVPSGLPHLYQLECSHNQLITVRDFPPDLPNLRDIILDGNALTSLHGLPSVVHISKNFNDPYEEDFEVDFEGKIDVANNYLENLAGIPSILIDYQPKRSLSHWYHPHQIYVIKGNALRSFHGIPRSELFMFTYDSTIPQQDSTRSNHHSKRDNPPTKYEEQHVKCARTSFYLSYFGAALLEKCINENRKLRAQHSNRPNHLDPFGFLQSLLPEDGPRSWHDVHNDLFEYYRLSPLELAHQYLAHLTSEGNSMSKEAIERLKYEGSITERKLLESNLPNPQEDQVLQAIQARLSVDLPEGRTLLL